MRAVRLDCSCVHKHDAKLMYILTERQVLGTHAAHQSDGVHRGRYRCSAVICSSWTHAVSLGAHTAIDSTHAVTLLLLAAEFVSRCCAGAGPGSA
jgi:hypothetical protein